MNKIKVAHYPKVWLVLAGPAAIGLLVFFLGFWIAKRKRDAEFSRLAQLDREAHRNSRQGPTSMAG